MEAITRKIYITRKVRIEPISIVQDSAVPIALQFMDYNIPAGASIRAYSRRKNRDEFYSTSASASENTVTLIAEPGFFVFGDNQLQIGINDRIFNFAIDVKCEVNIPHSGTASTPGGGSGGGTGTPGEDGGYYIPSVDTAGTLSWTASKSGMPTVVPANIKGPQGDTGAAGYTPVRGVDFWTDADIAQIKSYVDDAILGGAW